MKNLPIKKIVRLKMEDLRNLTHQLISEYLPEPYHESNEFEYVLYIESAGNEEIFALEVWPRGDNLRVSEPYRFQLTPSQKIMLSPFLTDGVNTNDL
jgi:hypothetical protein